MQRDKPSAWLSFRLAAEEVERRRGCTWGAAQKAVLDACASGALHSRPGQNGPDVLDNELMRWLSKPKTKPNPWKRSKINAVLTQMFPNARVPDPTQRPRKALKLDILERDPSLKSFDHATLKSAIDEHNAKIGNDPKSD